MGKIVDASTSQLLGLANNVLVDEADATPISFHLLSFSKKNSS
jgi:hypothetical protein